jgi:hypothetical protein
MDLILLEPPAHATRRHVAWITGIVPVIQLLDCVAQQGAFRRIDVCDVSPDSISQCHIYCLSLVGHGLRAEKIRAFSVAKSVFRRRKSSEFDVSNQTKR